MANVRAGPRRLAKTILGVALVILFLLLVAAWATTTICIERPFTRVATQLQTVVDETRTELMQLPDGHQFDIANVLAKLPSSMVEDGRIVQHYGRLRLEVLDPKERFRLTLSDIPHKDCWKFLAGDNGAGVESKGASTIRQRPNLPFSEADAKASCAGDLNEVMYVFN